MQKTLWLTVPIFFMILDYTAPCCKSGWIIPPPPPPRPCCCCCCCDYGWGPPPCPGPQPNGGGAWGGRTKRLSQMVIPKITDANIPWNESIPSVELPNANDTRPKFLATISTAFEVPLCSATIISAHFVLSACVRCLHFNGTSFHPDNVRIMVVDVPDESGKSNGLDFVVYEALSVTLHPECVHDGKYNLKHDVGLVQTVDAIKLSSSVVPAKIPQKKSYRPDVTEKWILAAYSAKKTMVDNVKDAVSFVKVPSVDPNTCKRVFNSTFYNETFNYCTPYHHDGRMDNCLDDFGAALAVDNTVFGILIHKFSCGKPGSAGSFVNVAYNSHWIRKTVKLLSNGTESV